MKINLSDNAIKAIKIAIEELESFENDGWQMFLSEEECDCIFEGIEELKNKLKIED